MKRIFTLSAPLAIGILSIALFISGCSKNNVEQHDNSENYWLSKEQGEVVYSDAYCDYFVVETYYGFNIVRAYGSYKPSEGSIVYGNFSNPGTRDLYNYSTGRVFSGTIVEYWLGYNEAQDALDYYCPYGYGRSADATAKKREFKASTVFNNKR